MSGKSLTEKMAEKKKADAEAAKQEDTKKEPTEAELQAAVAEELAKKEQTAQQVAKDAGATETPSVGGVATGTMSSIVEQTKTPTEAEVQARRTEVSTNVQILPSDPTGANPADPNPPLGTLPNSNLVYNGEPGSLMEQHHQQLQDGLAANAEIERQNEIALQLLQGEEKRQRLLEGRPRDTDLAEESEEMEAPEGGYKSLGMTRFVDAKGNWVKAEHGYFVPRDEEDVKILEHFVKVYAVEAPTKPAKKK